MFHSGLIEFVFWGRMVKSIAHPQHTFVGVLATCCSGVQLVVKSLAPAYTLDTCFFECEVFFWLRSKTRHRPNIFLAKYLFRGVRPKFHRYKLGGGMLLNYFIIINKKNPSPPARRRRRSVLGGVCTIHTHIVPPMLLWYQCHTHHIQNMFDRRMAILLRCVWQSVDNLMTIVSSYHHIIAA